MSNVIMNVPGISCSHCEHAITTAVEKLTGIKKVSVDITGKKVIVEFDSALVSFEQVKQAIEDQGYDVV
jgi:copper chaperone